MTRALEALARGELGESLALHALAVPTVLAQVGLAAATLFATWRFGVPWALGRTRSGRAAVGFAITVALLDLGLWAARGLGAFGGPVPIEMISW
jgi:hypothetical protein